MTEQEYFKAMGGVIGLCELCTWFGTCAKKGELKEDGCIDFQIEER